MLETCKLTNKYIIICKCETLTLSTNIDHVPKILQVLSQPTKTLQQKGPCPYEAYILQWRNKNKINKLISENDKCYKVRWDDGNQGRSAERE